jgi:adenylate cyclase class 2
VNIINVEIKAKVDTFHYNSIKRYLEKHHTSFKGLDKQSDYYFNTPQGKLKLRIGNVEKSLIYYDRKEIKDLKTSKIKLYKPVDRPYELLEILRASYGVKVEVHKDRLIYFIDHVKFHLDTIKGLGLFCEIEAISRDGAHSETTLKENCLFFINELNIDHSILIDQSYSDMLLESSD